MAQKRGVPKALKAHDNDIRPNVDSLELRIYRLLVAKNLETVLPNAVIAFRIYLSLMISNCSGERSFSKLKLIKNQLQSSMTQKRLNNFTRLSVEHDLLRNIGLSSLINDFAIQKSRKHIVYKACTDWDLKPLHGQMVYADTLCLWLSVLDIFTCVHFSFFLAHNTVYNVYGSSENR